MLGLIRLTGGWSGNLGKERSAWEEDLIEKMCPSGWPVGRFMGALSGLTAPVVSLVHCEQGQLGFIRKRTKQDIISQ